MSRLASTGPYAPTRTRKPEGLLPALLVRIRAVIGAFPFHLRSGSPLVDAVLDSAIDAWSARIAVGLVGMLGFPMYYVIWTYIIPQPFESLGMRLALAALFLPFLAPRAWIARLRRYWPWYWHGTLLLALPFFFTFMALENNTLSWALARLTEAAWAVRTLALTETCMPMKPAAPESTAPIRKPMAAAPDNRTHAAMKTTTPTMAMVVY